MGHQATPAFPVPALAVGDPEPLRVGLDRLGAGHLVELVSVRPSAAALELSAPPADVALVVAPWPAALEWVAGAPPGSPLAGGLPLLLVGGDPPQARLLVETSGEGLHAALAPAASGALVSSAEELLTLKAENRELRDALEARKAIERAKGILMEQQSISEREAFTRIQRLAMTKRKSMKEISEAIILSELTRAM